MHLLKGVLFAVIVAQGIAEEEMCGLPPNPKNGAKVMDHRKVGGKVTFTCETGFWRDGPKTLICKSGFTWSGSFPTCKAVRCPALSPIPNGNVTVRDQSLAIGAVATFNCHEGYSYSEPLLTRECQDNNTWSGKNGTCQAIICGPVRPVTNGRVDESGYTFRDKATITCDPGYTYDQEDRERFCEKSGKWSGNDGKCTERHCPVIAEVDHANTTFSGNVTYRSVATRYCDPGYELTGHRQALCQANGTWSVQLGACKNVQWDRKWLICLIVLPIIFVVIIIWQFERVKSWFRSCCRQLQNHESAQQPYMEVPQRVIESNTNAVKQNTKALDRNTKALSQEHNGINPT